MQACSDLAHVVLVLVGVRRVTVVIVHIGLEGVLVVMYFCVAILFVNCCIRRCSLYSVRRTHRLDGQWPRDVVQAACVTWMRDCCGCSSCAKKAWFMFEPILESGTRQTWEQRWST